MVEWPPTPIKIVSYKLVPSISPSYRFPSNSGQIDAQLIIGSIKKMVIATVI
jgi:hypothetical protein